MRKVLSICSIIGATITAIVCADIGLYLVSIISTVYMTFWLYCQGVTKKKPRSAKRSNKNRTATKILNFYDSTVRFGTQTKIKTPAGKMLMSVNYEE